MNIIIYNMLPEVFFSGGVFFQRHPHRHAQPTQPLEQIFSSSKLIPAPGFLPPGCSLFSCFFFCGFPSTQQNKAHGKVAHRDLLGHAARDAQQQRAHGGRSNSRAPSRVQSPDLCIYIYIYLYTCII